MKRQDLEHIIRASAAIAQVDTLVIVGSQSVLGAYPHAPAALLVSDEADILIPNQGDLADLVEGAIGEGSAFHDTFGYYAQAVDERTSILPEGWANRLVAICNENTRGAKGLCLDPHDLVVAKLVAGREKDLRFARDAFHGGILDLDLLRERFAVTTVHDVVRELTEARISALASAVAR